MAGGAIAGEGLFSDPSVQQLKPRYAQRFFLQFERGVDGGKFNIHAVARGGLCGHEGAAGRLPASVEFSKPQLVPGPLPRVRAYFCGTSCRRDK